MKSILLAGFALAASVAQASAAIVDVTYTGTVTYSTDQNGMFGTPGTDNIVGASFVANFIFDTTLGYTNSSPNYNYAYGGTGYPIANPLLSDNFTINGIPGTVDGSYAGEIFGCNLSSGCGVNEQFHIAEHYNYAAGNVLVQNYVAGEIYNYDPLSTLPGTIATPFTYTPVPSDNTYLQAYFATYDYNTNTQTNYTYVQANVSQLTETLVGATPLPSTWTMLIAGFLGLGFFACRGTKNRSAAIAAV